MSAATFEPSNSSRQGDAGQHTSSEIGCTSDLRVERDLLARSQDRFVSHLHSLTQSQQEALIARLANIQWNEFDNVFQPPDLSLVAPCEVVTWSDRFKLDPAVRQAGYSAYQAHEVAAIMVAGGDGSRLGFDAPKGCFLLPPLSGKSMYQVLAEKIKVLGDEFHYAVPFLIMTSPTTHQVTVETFLRHNYYGLESSQVKIFCQNRVPTVDDRGQLLLTDRAKLLESPNGHGGCLEALFANELLANLAASGIKDLIYCHVDNLLIPFYDPIAVGLRRTKGADLVTKVMAKNDPREKVGAIVRVDGRDSVVEYSDLSDEQKFQRAPDGQYLFHYGNMGSHVMGVDFLQRLQKDQTRLPYHLAKKMIKCWENGAIVTRPGIKRERFIFDILPLSKNLCLEVDRAAEFAPLKNASGPDSVDTAREIMTTQFASWLTRVGVSVELRPGAQIEISPLFAATFEQFERRWAQIRNHPHEITSDYYLE